MKAYLFDTKTGLYEGETFEEADMIQDENGLTAIPPPDFSHGEVPILDRQKGTWSVIPVTVARQLLGIGPEKAAEKAS